MRGEIIYCIHCGEVDSIHEGYCTNCGASQEKQQNLTLPDEQPVKNNMAQEQIFASGVRLFDKHPNAPDFVLASQVIGLNELFEWCKANPQYLADYQGKKQLKLQILRSRDGKIYTAVDTYGTPAQAAPPQQQSAPAPATSGWGAQPAAPAPAAQPAPFDYNTLPF